MGDSAEEADARAEVVNRPRRHSRLRGRPGPPKGWTLTTDDRKDRNMATSAWAHAAPRRKIEDRKEASVALATRAAERPLSFAIRLLGQAANSWAARRFEAFAFALLVVWASALANNPDVLARYGLAPHLSHWLATWAALVIATLEGAGLTLRAVGEPVNRALRKWGCALMAIFFGGLAGEFLLAAMVIPQGLGFSLLALWCLCGYIRLELLADEDVTMD